MKCRKYTIYTLNFDDNKWKMCYYFDLMWLLEISCLAMSLLRKGQRKVKELLQEHEEIRKKIRPRNNFRYLWKSQGFKKTSDFEELKDSRTKSRSKDCKNMDVILLLFCACIGCMQSISQSFEYPRKI